MGRCYEGGVRAINWSKASWQSKAASQQATYPDQDALHEILGKLSRLPPLVTSWEIEELKGKLDLAARGECFVLQGGDCAESFDDCESSVITAKLKILLQMSLVLVHGTKKQVVRVGRIAGQYAKPRSSETETRDGVTLPTYRGDLVNHPGFTSEERIPNPELLLRGYERAALTLNFIRSLADGGFADLHHPENWGLGFVKHSELADEYERIVESIRDSVEFMEAVSGTRASTNRVNFYTSHEGLHLPYEEAQTREVPNRDGWYNLSTHLPWIGKRTAELEGAHVEFFRGVRNPLGIKVGPEVTAEWLLELLGRLDPEHEPGRIMLIHRMGAGNLGKTLPSLIDAVRNSGRRVLWECDPMHGNTETTVNGIKTRRFDNILRELEQAFEIHQSCDSVLGGVHFELTGEDVTECMGGARDLSEVDLERDYRTRVDPRLNYEQALEMAMSIARHMAKMRS
ncbi:MAG: 3-deoxy-7-phosphoheptulonate synthase class II [Myxococcales bacterium]|nr:3-deoxy-7-phosphoheptulonate synthase class II [Myxococcales bacterium]